MKLRSDAKYKTFYEMNEAKVGSEI
jgi:hypothetical protein